MLRRPSATMECLCVAHEVCLPASLARPQREVHLFEIHEESFVEPVQLLEQGTPNQKKCPHDLINFAILLVVPLCHEMRLKESGEQSIQTDHRREKPPGRWESRARGDHAARLIEELNAHDAHAAVLRSFDECDWLYQCVLMQPCI